MSEFVMGVDMLAPLRPAVTVFGSARVLEHDAMYELARKTGCLLGEGGVSVFTGGGPGVMEAANRGAVEVHAHSVGLNIRLPEEQLPNPYRTLSFNFRYFFVCKVILVKYATAFVLFPGGFGTLDELFEVLTLVQTRKIAVFSLVLFGSGYWRGFSWWLDDYLVGGGYITREDRQLYYVGDTPREIADIVERARVYKGPLVNNVRLA